MKVPISTILQILEGLRLLNFIQKPLLGENGEVLKDKKGNIITDPSTLPPFSTGYWQDKSIRKLELFEKQVNKLKELPEDLKKLENEKLEEFRKIVIEKCHKDKEGKPLQDERGNPLAIDEDGKPIIENGIPLRDLKLIEELNLEFENISNEEKYASLKEAQENINKAVEEKLKEEVELPIKKIPSNKFDGFSIVPNGSMEKLFPLVEDE